MTRIAEFANRCRSLSNRTRVLIGLWTLFLLLVAFKIHGSSIDRAALVWRPEGHGTESSDYLLEPLVDFARDKLGEKKFDLPKFPELYGEPDRSDEYKVGTPYAIAQCTHHPPCPVINTNIGFGQNMLPVHCVPVWHVASLARPATWGYLLFGAERGLAWYWWFQPFSCFTALFLLLEIILKGQLKLAAFGAFWCVASASLICWSNVPAYFTFFPAAGCVAGYRLMQSPSMRVQCASAVALGLLVPGFVMLLYPGWQVSLGYLFLVLFVALCLRDGLLLKVLEKKRAAFSALAVLLAAALGASFFVTCQSTLKILAATEFPGHRFSSGGGVFAWQLFKGWYNFWSIHQRFEVDGNVCESASAYHLYPAVVIAAIASKRLRKDLSIIGWALVAFIAVMVVFMNRGFPDWLARCTLMSYVLPKRADAAVGIASVLLCVQALSIAAQQPPDREARRSAWLAGGGMACLLALLAVLTIKATNYTIVPHVAFAVVLAGGYLAYCLILGKTETFCGGMALILLATTALFNPLARGLNGIFNSEMARQIVVIEKESTEKPLWLCYGDEHPGVLVTMLNARSLSGVHFCPQLDVWHQLDRARKYEAVYNRYAHVGFLLNTQNPDPAEVEFSVPRPESDSMIVRLSPLNPVLKKWGAKYVLVYGSEQKNFESLPLTLLYKGRNGVFTIYEIP